MSSGAGNQASLQVCLACLSDPARLLGADEQPVPYHSTCAAAAPVTTGSVQAQDGTVQQGRKVLCECVQADDTEVGAGASDQDTHQVRAVLGGAWLGQLCKTGRTCAVCRAKTRRTAG